jgi:hypothetical protein
MPYRRHAPLKLVLGRALLAAIASSACATGVEPELEDQPLLSDEGASGGALAQGGSSAGTASPPAKAGSSAAGGSSANPFGGTASVGGKAGSTGGDAGAGTGAGGFGGGGKAGGGGGSAGSSSAGAGGSGCACAKTLTWTDNTVMSWGPGDCVTAGSATYVYIGTKAQTYANGQCNPAKQEPWCPDTSNDYKFMACP